MNAVILASPGELIDKITILEIKKSRIKDKQSLSVIKKELGLLKITLAEMLKLLKNKKAQALREKKTLLGINKKLWDIENKIRAKEAKKQFDNDFIKLARSVYIVNDKRSEVKKKINSIFGSSIREVKQYKSY